eukprot:XP_016659214.1 PREDICTED: uncharacterized protein LOC103309172 [Acyrthosiphon pisum]
MAFVLTAILQIKITEETTEISPGQRHINIYNGFDCNVFVRSESLNLHDHIEPVEPLEVFNVTHTVVSRNFTENVVKITFGFEAECNFVPENYNFETTVTITEGEEISLQRDGDTMHIRLFTRDEGNYIHTLWQLPQYLVMTTAEVIFVVTVNKFEFTEVYIFSFNDFISFSSFNSLVY